MFVEIQGENVPIEEEEISFWMAEFVESWKCPKTNMYHSKGETTRCCVDPRHRVAKTINMGNRHYGLDHEVPFNVLRFWQVNHTVYTLRHRVTKTVEWSEDVRDSD